MKNILFVILLTIGLFCQAQERISVYPIDLLTFQTEVIGKNVQLIDVRSEREYSQGYIDNAINITIADTKKFTIEIQKLDKTKPIYVYCHAGIRSQRAGKLITELGFTEIYDFRGGWRAWIEQNK